MINKSDWLVFTLKHGELKHISKIVDYFYSTNWIIFEIPYSSYYVFAFINTDNYKSKLSLNGYTVATEYFGKHFSEHNPIEMTEEIQQQLLLNLQLNLPLTHNLSKE